MASMDQDKEVKMDKGMSFGRAIQTSYVVADMDSAIAHWIEKIGVGPFFVNRRMQFDNAWHYERKAPVTIASATAYWGEMQIELIQPESPGPNVYRGPWDGSFMTMHHLGVLSAEIDRDIAYMDQMGFQRAFYMEQGPIRIAYFDTTPGSPGGLVELIPALPPIVELFEIMRAASKSWDGTNPIREKTAPQR